MTVTAEAFGDALRRHGIVAILRGVSGMTLAARVAALHAAGIRLIEISLSDLTALPLVAELRRIAPPDMLVGAGTVTSADLAAAAVEAGALASATETGDFSEAADEARRLVAAFELCGRDRGAM